MLIVAAAQSGAALAANRVDFIDEDQAGRVLAPLVEHVAHPRGADADKHLHEVRARHGEEGHVGLARDRLGQQRLAGPTEATHQHTP